MQVLNLLGHQVQVHSCNHTGSDQLRPDYNHTMQNQKQISDENSFSDRKTIKSNEASTPTHSFKNDSFNISESLSDIVNGAEKNKDITTVKTRRRRKNRCLYAEVNLLNASDQISSKPITLGDDTSTTHLSNMTSTNDVDDINRSNANNSSSSVGYSSGSAPTDHDQFSTNDFSSDRNLIPKVKDIEIKTRKENNVNQNMSSSTITSVPIQKEANGLSEDSNISSDNPSTSDRSANEVLSSDDDGMCCLLP